MMRRRGRAHLTRPPLFDSTFIYASFIFPFIPPFISPFMLQETSRDLLLGSFILTENIFIKRLPSLRSLLAFREPCGRHPSSRPISKPADSDHCEVSYMRGHRHQMVSLLDGPLSPFCGQARHPRRISCDCQVAFP